MINQSRRFSLGFYEDLGDMGDDADTARAAETVRLAAIMQQQGATAQMQAGQDAAPLELAALQNFQTGRLLSAQSGYSSASPSGSQTSAGDSSGVFDFAKSAFGSLANAFGAVAPSAFQTFVPKRYAPIFGVQPPQAPVQPKPTGPSTTTLAIGALVIGGGFYLLSKKSGGGGGTHTNPKKKGKKSKAKGSHKKSSKKKGGKRKGKKKGKR